jgi:hypothetical protein
MTGRKPSRRRRLHSLVLRKAVFYQRTAGSSSKNHRKLQENHKVFNEYSRQNAELADFIHAGAKTAKEIAQAKGLDAHAAFLAR